MTIETYTDTYHNDVLELARSFHGEALHKFDMEFDPETITRNIAQLKEKQAGNCFLLIIDGKCEGIFAGFETLSLFNSKRVFVEMIWYVNPIHRKHGVKMFKRAQEILKEQGFNTLIMIALEDSMAGKVERFYRYMGLKKFQTDYIKEL